MLGKAFLVAVVVLVTFSVSPDPYLMPVGANAGHEIPFSATSELLQTDAGTSVITISAGLPGFPDGIEGRLSTGQGFAGAVTDTDWDALAGSQLSVQPHNSFLTFLDGVPDFAGGEEQVVGVVFGVFSIQAGAGMMASQYVMALSGRLVHDPVCQPDASLALIPGFDGRVRVEVMDVGGWEVLHREGIFTSVAPQGEAMVVAEGCLGVEAATITATGSRALSVGGVITYLGR